MWSSTVVFRGKEAMDGLAGRGTQAQGGGCPGRCGAASRPARGACGGPRRGGRAGDPGHLPGRIGTVAVPPWQEGTGASVLPRAYQDLLEVAADWQFHLEREHQRLYTGIKQGQYALGA